jgi:hypothetical protein
MADISILDPAVSAVPKSYKVKGAQEIVLKGVTASYDGTGAGGSFIPAVQVVDPSGFIVGTYTLGSTLTAGASADVSWFPGVTPAAASSGGGNGFQFNAGTYGADNVGDWSLIEASGTNGIPFSQANAAAGNDANVSMGVNASNGIVFTDSVNNLNGAVEIIHITDTVGPSGAYGLVVAAEDRVSGGTNGTIAINVTAKGKGTIEVDGIVVNAEMDAGGTNDAYGIQAGGANVGTGREIGGLFSTGGFKAGANSIALLCVDSSGNPIFEVRNDGSVHIKTATAVIADL